MNIPLFPTVSSLIAQIDAASLESYSTEEEWIEARKNGIGASESAILFGQGYAGSSPYKMYCEKLGLIPRDDMEQKSLRIGKLMEPVLRRLCTEETGLPCYEVGENHTFRSTKYSFLTASLDGLIIDEGGIGVLELKNIHYFNREEWSDGSGPLKYQIQLQHQLAVTNLQYGYLFGLVGGQEPYAHKIQRNDSFIEKALIPACESFFQAMQSRNPPDIDGSEATAKAIKLLHPDDDGSEILLDERFSDFDLRLEEIKAQQKSLDSERKIIENEFKSAIGSSTFGLLSSGTRYSLKTTQKDGYWVNSQKYRTLLRKKAT